MTKPAVCTQASIRRAITAARQAGLHVIAIKPDGTVVVAETPADIVSPEKPSSSEYEDVQA